MMDKTSLFCCVLFAIFLRCGVSLNAYSGAGKPPMYGDYEAQRHWMEITFNLPIQQWYNASKDNDLMYWGLDYPPLTAYHSKLCGYIANLLNPDWVALHKSRGHESYQHKLFMRWTVLIADVAIYFMAIIYFVTAILKKREPWEQMILLVMMLGYPGLILIDHGHFQYNCISLGFTVISTIFILKHNHVMASIFFVLALNYKQMELYHAFPYFFYLLAVSWNQVTWFKKILKLASIGLAVISTFALSWLPFLTSIESALIVLQRLFPFNRGLFEDKVANVWCAISVVIKIKKILTQQSMVRLCLLSTLLACTPSCFDLLRNPTRKKFLYSMFNCSMAFFLFSYQVHEKSILIPAVSACMILPYHKLASSWLLMISTFSMYPLLVRDGQSVAYFALLILYALLASFFCQNKTSQKQIYRLIFFSFVGCALLHVAFLAFNPPPSLPDLFPLMFAVWSCCHFVFFWLYFNYVQYTSPKIDSEIVDGEVKLTKKTQ